MRRYVTPTVTDLSTKMISLRKSVPADLEVFFTNQADDEANHMAAFTSENPKDKAAYIAKWTRLMSVDSVHMQTILLNNAAIGCVVKFVMGGDADVTYALDKAHWGKGIVSEALRQFLTLEKTRPLYGRVAFDNLGSQKVLERNGFIKVGTNVDFANARGKEIEEFIYQLA